MKEDAYRAWLAQRYTNSAVAGSRLANCRTVEKHRGDLDPQFNSDRLVSLLEALKYTKGDEKSGRPNSSKIPINGNIYNGLATYKNAVGLYKLFRESMDGVGAPELADPASRDGATQRIGLERDLQAALRARIEQLEAGLVIIDNGYERSVASGLIDITAKDASGAVVVIELKAGSTGARAVSQILSYMGDVSEEEAGAPVRGIVVASDFDHRAQAAARMVPKLRLYRYEVSFSFSDGSGAPPK